MNNKKIRLATLLLMIVLISCRTKLYIPSAANASADASLADLLEGRNIYSEKCSNCHRLHLPATFSHDEWIVKVNKMQQRAHINNDEKNLILEYLWNAPAAKSSK